MVADNRRFWLRLGRIICGVLAVVDLGLSVGVLLSPDLFVDLLQPGLGDPQHALVARTGVLWAVFCLVESAAFFRGARLPELFLSVAVLRLMDVPADLVWLMVGDGFTTFGVVAIASAPPANLAAGLVLLRVYRVVSSRGGME